MITRFHWFCNPFNGFKNEKNSSLIVSYSCLVLHNWFNGKKGFYLMKKKPTEEKMAYTSFVGNKKRCRKRSIIIFELSPGNSTSIVWFIKFAKIINNVNIRSSWRIIYTMQWNVRRKIERKFMLMIFHLQSTNLYMKFITRISTSFALKTSNHWLANIESTSTDHSIFGWPKIIGQYTK